MSPITCVHCNQTSNRFSPYEYACGQRDGDATCKDCERGVPRCTICTREFIGKNFRDSLNQLKMHRQSHLPRAVTCPVCRSDRKFRSGADAILHLESGYCEGCRGQANAKQQIYEYVSRHAPQFVSSHPLLEWDGSFGRDPEYSCKICGKVFTALSSLMQHETAKHNGGQTSSLRIGGY
jgi:hypothetical protein